MATSKRANISTRGQGSRDSNYASPTRSSLPPKPNCNKRTRNNLASANMPPPPPNPSQPARARAQRVWGRRSASWTAEEDAKLVELVKKESATPPSITASKTWSRVAAQLTNRTGKQCRERYLNQLKPGIRRDPWSPEEERILRETHAQIGNKWVAIANRLPGRTDNCVKNHWNSMLRKRKRREAALKAAQAEVVATLGRSQPARLDLDRSSEAEYSVRTGCATPSGASSSFHDFPLSGIPSPYTASSPITPKRDSKLQISTLVAASTKELPTWNVPYLQVDSGHQGAYYGAGKAGMLHGEAANVARQQFANRSQPISATARSMPHVFVHHSGRMGTENDPDKQTMEKPNAPGSPFMSKGASVMQCIAASSRVPQLMHVGHSDGKNSGDPARQVRRSSRLLSSSMKERPRPGGCLVNSQAIRSVDKNVNKARCFDSSSGTNALVALAAAASSVPPSPLTPESRFSATSRSRSASPNSRMWHPGRAGLVSSSRLDGSMMKRRSCERHGLSLDERSTKGSVPHNADEGREMGTRAEAKRLKKTVF